jgi:hypothetical protein
LSRVLLRCVVQSSSRSRRGGPLRPFRSLIYSTRALLFGKIERELLLAQPGPFVSITPGKILVRVISHQILFNIYSLSALQ